MLVSNLFGRDFGTGSNDTVLLIAFVIFGVKQQPACTADILFVGLEFASGKEKGYQYQLVRVFLRRGNDSQQDRNAAISAIASIDGTGYNLYTAFDNFLRLLVGRRLALIWIVQLVSFGNIVDIVLLLVFNIRPTKRTLRNLARGR